MITPRIKPSGFFLEEAADDMELVRQRKAKLEGYVNRPGFRGGPVV